MLRKLLRLSLSVALVAGAAAVAVAVPGIAPPVPTALAAPSGFTGLTPARLLDTREGNGAPAAAVGPGGVVDLHKASEIFVHEFRGGVLGRISLERPA